MLDLEQNVKHGERLPPVLCQVLYSAPLLLALRSLSSIKKESMANDKKVCEFCFIIGEANVTCFSFWRLIRYRILYIIQRTVHLVHWHLYIYLVISIYLSISIYHFISISTSLSPNILPIHIYLPSSIQVTMKTVAVQLHPEPHRHIQRHQIHVHVLPRPQQSLPHQGGVRQLLVRLLFCGSTGETTTISMRKKNLSEFT